MKVSKIKGLLIPFFFCEEVQMDKEVLQQIIARTATEKKQNRNITISSLTKVGVILYLIKKVCDIT
jgi:hypothetical protein